MSVNAGIDIGSVATKCVIVRDKDIISKALAKTGSDTEQSAGHVFHEALKNAGLHEKELGWIVSTGYGRRLFTKANKVITEISAVATGAFAMVGKRECLIVDVGGQDTKIVEVGATAEVTDFLMNDKCAAGTGRFLEMMAGVLETDLNGLSELAMKAHSAVTINATCSVFAESEVVSLLAHAAKKEDIAAGIIKAIAVRIAFMMGQFRKSRDTIFFCGGGAHSPALRAAIEQICGHRLMVPEEPQFVTAFGAALSC